MRNANRSKPFAGSNTFAVLIVVVGAVNAIAQIIRCILAYHH